MFSNQIIRYAFSLLMLYFLLVSCDPYKKEFKWQVESPKNLHLDTELLNKLIKKVKDSSFHAIDAILLIKDEKIVLEEYFNGYTKDSMHNTASVGKSITSALVGIAIQQGLIPSLETTVMDYFTDSYRIRDLNTEKKNITIYHFLTMTSGLACDDWDEDSPGNTKHFVTAKDDFALTLNLPMVSKNGKRFAYCSGGANLLGEIIRKASGKSLKEYADTVLFNKIGVYENEWFIVPKPPHNEFAGGGNYLKPRDMAKFGLLYKNKGKWEGEQIIPEKWIEESTSTQIEVPNESAAYGYFWWVKEYTYKERKIPGFEASGNGGNKIIVLPKLDLVFILTGSGYGNEYIEGEQARIIFENYILKSVNTSSTLNK
ncbi:serine hydrolase [Aquimarina sp. U1-2]|uniref:serine hydrolase domain-containing protein n=1 Tax=Aquimarina sp. U1-2 TaxID=2823141 RepID=UPI001AEC8AB4|nr:serine hydrolase [Aquimarina sp. U1-2]MBP2830853.1 serine hydrolase [Aquimarina sp. U1-2]